jgi:hypothetical protein
MDNHQQDVGKVPADEQNAASLARGHFDHTMCVVLKRAVCAYAEAVAVATPTTLATKSQQQQQRAHGERVDLPWFSSVPLRMQESSKGVSAKTLRCSHARNNAKQRGGRNLEQAVPEVYNLHRQ